MYGCDTSRCSGYAAGDSRNLTAFYACPQEGGAELFCFFLQDFGIGTIFQQLREDVTPVKFGVRFIEGTYDEEESLGKHTGDKHCRCSGPVHDFEQCSDNYDGSADGIDDSDDAFSFVGFIPEHEFFPSPNFFCSFCGLF